MIIQFDEKMAAKPLTDEEKQQLAVWQNNVFLHLRIAKIPSL